MTGSFLDASVVSRAETEMEKAVRDLLYSSRSPRATVVTAPAGAGKSVLISRAVGRAQKEGKRVVVGAPTNEQAWGLVRRVFGENPGLPITYLPGSKVTPPGWMENTNGLSVETDSRVAARSGVLIATLSKLGDAFTRGDLTRFDCFLIDESFQADSARYFAAAGISERHLLVGDGGQINPFSTMKDPTRWRGLPEDPLQTAVGVILRNHPSTPVFGLPITRRLDSRAARIAQFFYPNLEVKAAVLPGVRELNLASGTSVDRNTRTLDEILDRAGRDGWAYVTLPSEVVVSADRETISVIVSLVKRLLERSPTVSCERPDRARRRRLTEDQIAIGTSQNDQKDLLRTTLDQAGLRGVKVDTANKLQGLEFEVTLMWHPLSGLPEPDEFHLDPGRLCVMLTRHRQACIVIGRQGDRNLVDKVPPATAAYIGHDVDPVLDGWEIHNAVFGELERVRVEF